MTTAHPPSPPTRQLAPGAVLSLRISRPGQQLCVSQGRVWVTLHGAPDDHFIAAGQSLALPRGARVLMECDSAEPALWTLVSAQAAPSGKPAGLADNAHHEHARIPPNQHHLVPQRP